MITIVILINIYLDVVDRDLDETDFGGDVSWTAPSSPDIDQDYI